MSGNRQVTPGLNWLTSEGAPDASADVDVPEDQDDVLLPVSVVDGRLSASGLPAGAWVVETPDGSAASGTLRLAAGGTLSGDVVVAGEASPTTAPVASPVLGSLVPGLPVVPARSAQQLASTGSSAAVAGGMAGVLLGGGGLLVALTRRSRRAPRHRA